jgi:hypothetical protein
MFVDGDYIDNEFEDLEFTGENIEFNSLSITCSTQEDNKETPN